jgi:hypothetical protein
VIIKNDDDRVRVVRIIVTKKTLASGNDNNSYIMLPTTF